MFQPKLYFDLTKAFDKTKLVQVQRTVTRANGTTFTQTFWVNPKDVKSSDNVIGNQKILDDYRNSQKKSSQQISNASSTFDQSQYDKLKVTDRNKAMEYAKQCGVVFTEVDKNGNPLSDAIKWMRCQMAVSALKNSSNPTVTVPTTKPLNTSLLGSSFDTMSKKDKVAALLQNNSRDDLMKWAVNNGVTWSAKDKDGNPVSPAVEWMRASMALQKFVENKTLTDIKSGNNSTPTTSPVPQQNSIQNQVVKQSSDKLEIPANATKREENIIKLLNNVTDEADLELYKSVGIIAEDDDAKSFIKDKLKPRYDQWKKGHQPSAGGHSYISNSTTFGNNMSDQLNNLYKGLPKKTLKKAFERCFDIHSTYGLLYARRLIKPLNRVYAENYVKDEKQSQTLSNIIEESNSKFSQYYTDNNGKIVTSNDDWDLEICKKNYDVSKEGFVQVLNHISSQDSTLKTECDRIIKSYDEMMQMVECNHNLLKAIIKSSYWGSYSSDFEKTIAKYENSFKASQTIIDILRDEGYSDDVLRKTIENSDWEYFNDFRIRDLDGKLKRDSNGNVVKVDLTKDPRWDKSYGDYLYGSDDVKQILSALDGKLEDIDAYKQYTAYKSITPELYCKVKAKTFEIMNVDLVQQQISSTTGTTNDVVIDLNTIKNTSDWDDKIAHNNDYKYKEKPGGESTDFVFGNLCNILTSISIKDRIAIDVVWDCANSAANKNGTDYSGNFNFYRVGSNSKHISDGLGAPELTVDEIKSTTKKILSEEKVYSAEYLSNFRKHAETHGDSNFIRNSYSSNPTAVELQSKVRSVGIEKGSSMSDFNDTPMKDILYDYLTSIASYCPQMKTTRYSTMDKLKKHIADTVGYTPFKFDNGQQNAVQSSIPSNKLKALRQEVFKKINCTLKTCDQKTTDYTQRRIKHGWDNGKMNSAGNARLYGSITADFTTGKSYKVNNSIQMQRMLEHSQKLGEKPQDFFHGTGHSGAAGIVGVDGKFVCTGKNGSMLGKGIYLAEDAGKSAGYFGTWGSGYNKEGCMLLCKAVLGNVYQTSSFSQAPAGYDTTHMKAGTFTGRAVLRADEWCVRNPDFVAPEYIVDMTVKSR